MAAHAEIIVRTPDHDVARTVRRVPARARKVFRVLLDLGEDAVAAFVLQLIERVHKNLFVVHVRQLSAGRVKNRSLEPFPFSATKYQCRMCLHPCKACTARWLEKN